VIRDSIATNTFWVADHYSLLFLCSCFFDETLAAYEWSSTISILVTVYKRPVRRESTVFWGRSRPGGVFHPPMSQFLLRVFYYDSLLFILIYIETVLTTRVLLINDLRPITPSHAPTQIINIPKKISSPDIINNKIIINTQSSKVKRIISVCLFLSPKETEIKIIFR